MFYRTFSTDFVPSRFLIWISPNNSLHLSTLPNLKRDKKRTLIRKSHDPCFHKKYGVAGVTTFVAHCTIIRYHSPSEVGHFGFGLAGVVVGAQLGDEFGRVLRGVHGQGLGNHQQGAGELSDGQLLPRALRTSK